MLAVLWGGSYNSEAARNLAAAKTRVCMGPRVPDLRLFFSFPRTIIESRVLVPVQGCD